MSKRDSQRTKFYNAERTVPQTALGHQAAVAFGQKITRSAWWKKRHPRELLITGYARANQGCLVYKAQSAIFGDADTKLKVIHNLAHQLVVATENPNEVAWHGPEFVRLYLQMVERYIGKDAKFNLTAIFRQNGVKTTTWSPEAKAKAKERALKNPERTTFGAAKIERDRQSVLDLLNELHEPETPPEPLPQQVIDDAALGIAVAVLRSPQINSFLATYLTGRLANEEERVRNALKVLADSFGQEPDQT